MDYIKYKGNDLFVEDIKISDLLHNYKKPFYCYSASYIEERYIDFIQAQQLKKVQISYAVKANSNLSVLKLLADLGAGADVVSLGELMRAVRVGIDPQKIVFSGVGKTIEEIRYAIEIGVGQINIESLSEMYLISNIAYDMQKSVNISMRVNPNVDPETHAKISTGEKTEKFGIVVDDFEQVIEFVSKDNNLNLVGLSCHIGSQIRKVEPYHKAYLCLRGLVQELQDNGITLQTVDLGGGIGISYDGKAVFSFQEYAKMVFSVWSEYQHLKFIFEPGRSIVGNGGVIVAKVLYNKPVDNENNFIILDAGMNDLMRPALYSAVHDIVPVSRRGDEKSHAYHIVGPICESSDIFERNKQSEELREGDYVAILSAGAYGYTMANEYNTKPLAEQWLVKGDQCKLVGKGNDIEDIIGRDLLVNFD